MLTMDLTRLLSRVESLRAESERYNLSRNTVRKIARSNATVFKYSKCEKRYPAPGPVVEKLAERLSADGGSVFLVSINNADFLSKFMFFHFSVAISSRLIAVARANKIRGGKLRGAFQAIFLPLPLQAVFLVLFPLWAWRQD